MLDTNVCIRALRNKHPQVRERLKAERSEICISTVILHELYVGAALSIRPEHEAHAVSEFALRLQVLDFDEDAAFHAANIRADLTKRGLLIGPNDILIAGHARSLGLKLISGNLGEFTRVEGLRCEDWL